MLSPLASLPTLFVWESQEREVKAEFILDGKSLLSMKNMLNIVACYTNSLMRRCAPCDQAGGCSYNHDTNFPAILAMWICISCVQAHPEAEEINSSVFLSHSHTSINSSRPHKLSKSFVQMLCESDFYSRGEEPPCWVFFAVLPLSSCTCTL